MVHLLLCSFICTVYNTHMNNKVLEPLGAMLTTSSASEPNFCNKLLRRDTSPAAHVSRSDTWHLCLAVSFASVNRSLKNTLWQVRKELTLYSIAWISIILSAILTNWCFHSFPQYILASDRRVPTNKPRLPYSTSLPAHHFTIISLDATQPHTVFRRKQSG